MRLFLVDPLGQQSAKNEGASSKMASPDASCTDVPPTSYYHRVKSSLILQKAARKGGVKDIETF